MKIERVPQVDGVKALREPAIDEGQQLAGCGTFALALPQMGKASRFYTITLGLAVEFIKFSREYPMCIRYRHVHVPVGALPREPFCHMQCTASAGGCVTTS